LAAVLLVSAVPTALATNDYSQGTQVVYEATGSESYTITVPAQLAPGGNGTVTLSGTWADNRIVTVTADPTVTLTNSIKAEDQKVLNVHFDGISEAGSNTGSQTFTQGISVDNITDALFGTWSGKFNYNVEITGGSDAATPIAYSYNGVELPDINEVWTDKETYPYAYIAKDTSGYINLYLCKGKPVVKKMELSPYKLVVDFSDYAKVYSRFGAWNYNNSSTFCVEIEDIGDFEWASVDIINTIDGTLYLAASDPVPVYE